MNDSSFLWETRFDGRFAVELDSGLGGLIAGTRTQANAAASVITNAQDYARFVAAVMNGAGVKPETRATWLEPQVAITSKSLFSRPGTDGGANLAHKLAWTPGWGTFEDARGRALFHVGMEEGCENFTEIFTERQLAVVFLSLTDNAHSFSAPLVEYSFLAAGFPRWSGSSTGRRRPWRRPRRFADRCSRSWPLPRLPCCCGDSGEVPTSGATVETRP